MKWIGQNIYDQVSRFRNKVYFEGDVEFNADAVTFQSANTDDPIVTIKNTSNGTNDAASLVFIKDRADNDVAQGTNLAEIYFKGEDSAQNAQEYGRIISEIDVSTNGQESGSLKLGVANHDGGNGYGLALVGGSANDEVDVTIGLGGDSITTIAGTLTMGSTAIVVIPSAKLDTDTAHLSVNNVFTGATQTITSDGAGRPAMIIQNTGNNTTGGFLVFSLEKGAAGADDDLPGYISWQSVSDTQRQLTFGTIYTQVSDATDGEGAGNMHLQVASYDGTLRSGLYLDGDTNAAGEVDVTIAAGAASKTTITGDLAVGGDDVTIYNAVNDSNPTISLGSAAANRFEIKTAYNSGAQTLDEVYFSTYTTSGSTNDGRYIWEVDEVELMRLLDDGLNVVDGYINAAGTDAFLATRNSNASSATEGGRLKLICDDGAAMADDHRLGVIEFSGAEDGSANKQTGARIQAMCDAAWSASENGTRLEFYTMDGNAASELSLTLDSDLLATFAGGVTVTGTITGDVTGDLTGEAATVATIAGLAPNTATTQATQAAITTCANLVTVGTIGTGVWNATAIASAKMATGTSSAQGALELATTAEATTGTDTARAVTPAGLKAYADRPAKQIVLMRAAFKDDIGTTKHYIPLQSELEQTNSFHEMNSFVAPFAGKLLKLMYNGSGNFSGGEFSFTLEQIPRNVAFATTPTVLETIAIDGPTNDTTDPNMIIANFVGGSGTNSFTAGDLIMVGIQSDADVTSSTSKHFFTLVFEFDFSSLA